MGEERRDAGRKGGGEMEKERKGQKRREKGNGRRYEDNEVEKRRMVKKEGQRRQRDEKGGDSYIKLHGKADDISPRTQTRWSLS